LASEILVPKREERIMLEDRPAAVEQTLTKHMYKPNGNLGTCAYVEPGPGRQCREPREHDVHTPTGTTRESWLRDKAHAMGHRERDAVRAILSEFGEWPPTVVVEALHVLVDSASHWRDSWAYAKVDGDRQVRAAMAASESCEHHGAEITALGQQVDHFDKAYHQADGGRVALLGLLHSLDEAVRLYDRKVAAGENVPDSPALFEKLREMTAAARKDHDRAWKK
jgi:hypothetical protein